MTTYRSDSQMTSLLNQMDVYVLPVFNIDGYDYTWKSVCNLCLNVFLKVTVEPVMAVGIVLSLYFYFCFELYI